MTSREDLKSRRNIEQNRIKQALNSVLEKQFNELKGGEEHVAFVHENLCIGCDQCTLVCDDEAIELYYKANRNSILEIESNRKARIIRDECTGCRLCVLACPTDAIVMIER